jgi:pyrroloquinoline-quinone synthase
MKSQDTLDRLDQLIESRSILKHPFYVAWRNGELTSEQLGTYAQMYYPHIAAFPGYLESAIESAVDESVRVELENNLEDELSNPKPHPELWLDFAAGLGFDRESVKNAAVQPAAADIVSSFNLLTGNGSAAGLAALYAYESQQPEVSRQKADGLRELYGVSDPGTLAYFEVHAEADLVHRQGERRALVHLLNNGASPEQVITSAEQALDAYWDLLDGICAEAGVSTN